MRSIFGRERVTQTVRPCGSRGGSFAFGHQRQARLRPGGMAADENFGRRRAGVTQPGRHALAELLAFVADDDGGSPREFRRPRRHSFVRIGGLAPGMKRGSAANSSFARTSMSAGPCGTPIRRASFSADMVLNDDMMMRPWRETGAILQLSPHGEIASPSPNHNPGPPSVNRVLCSARQPGLAARAARRTRAPGRGAIVSTSSASIA